MSSSDKRIALVTGGNKGIGLQVATELAQAGLTVLIGCRNVEAGQKAVSDLLAKRLKIECIELDLCHSETIQNAAKTIESKYQGLDVLVNNAGIIVPSDGAPSISSMDSVRKTMDTNFFGTLEVTQAMLPLLHKTNQGHIINVSSGLGSITLNNQSDWEYANVRCLGYSASKAALNMMTVQLASELKDTTICVNSVCPGYTATDLNGHSGPQTLEEGAAEIVRLALLTQNVPTGGFLRTSGTFPW